MKTYKGRRGIAPHILNLGAGWRWVVNSRLDSCMTGKEPSVTTEQKADSTQTPIRRVTRVFLVARFKQKRGNEYEQDMQRTYNVTLRRVRLTIVVVEKD